MNDRILSFLGLCRKAGKLAVGLKMSEEAVETGKAHLIIAAPDGSEKTKKSAARAAEESGIPMVQYGSLEEIGRAIGEKSTAVVAVCDANMAKKLLTSLGEKGGTD